MNTPNLMSASARRTVPIDPFAGRRSTQEVEQQTVHHARLLVLHPMRGVGEMKHFAVVAQREPGLGEAVAAGFVSDRVRLSGDCFVAALLAMTHLLSSVIASEAQQSPSQEVGVA
jgi:hypothetical protein